VKACFHMLQCSVKQAWAAQACRRHAAKRRSEDGGGVGQGGALADVPQAQVGWAKAGVVCSPRKFLTGLLIRVARVARQTVC
jgi:hypothetical protein